MQLRGLGEDLPDGGVEQACAVRDGLVEVHAALAERAGHGVHEGERRPQPAAQRTAS